ncbi:MAG: zinc-binding dehydrogenase, partial [Kineosporiaceae bacterium]
EEGAAAVRDLLDGVGADCVLECVGSAGSVAQAVATVRDGGRIGVVGLPHGIALAVREMFYRNVSWSGGVAPARAYIPELLPEVLGGDLDASPVFDVVLPLAEVAEGYRRMDGREAVKVLLRP